MGIKGKFTRSIFAKINDEGRNIILRHTQNLKGKNTSVYTQLPRELAEHKKKQLVPLFKQARAANKSTRWLGDKLMVGNQVHDAKPDHLGNSKTWFLWHSMPDENWQHEGSRFQASKVEIDDPQWCHPCLQAVYADPQVAGATHKATWHLCISHPIRWEAARTFRGRWRIWSWATTDGSTSGKWCAKHLSMCHKMAWWTPY